MWIPPAYSRSSLPAILAATLRPDADAPDRLRRHLVTELAAEAVRLTDSGTGALRLALAIALEGAVGEDRTVALPAYGCYDLLSAAEGAGARVAFYDIDPRTLAPVPDSVGASLSSARVLVAANLYGFPIDWTELRETTRAAGAVLIEDAAQAVGSSWSGRPGGSIGDLSILSFGRGKGWTGGGGGAVLGRGRFAGRVDALSLPASGRSLGRLAAGNLGAWLLARPTLYGIPARVPSLGLGETHYVPPVAPTGIHPACASLAWRNRGALASDRRERWTRVERLDAVFDAAKIPRPEPLPGGVASWLRYPVLLGDRPAAHFNPLGVYRGYPRSLPDAVAHGISSVVPVERRSHPGAEALAHDLWTAPTHARTPIRLVVDGLRARPLAER
ncbi:MAG: DegT/DnrJ/EryC1/StrS family aminotransferase [Longimicrobiales bacterium]